MNVFVLTPTSFYKVKDQLKALAQQWIDNESNGNIFNIDVDADKHINDLERLVNDWNSDLLLMVNDKDRIVGYMGVTVYDSPISAEKIGNEHYFYVEPASRGIGGLRLIKTAKIWAKQKGCSHLQLNASLLASDLHDKVCRLYESLGAKKFETSFLWRIN